MEEKGEAIFIKITLMLPQLRSSSAHSSWLVAEHATSRLCRRDKSNGQFSDLLQL